MMTNHPNKPRYQLQANSVIVNGSWWMDRPRDQFTRYAAQSEWPRMRSSKFGGLSVVMTLGPAEPNAREQFLMRKRAAEASRTTWEPFV
jgi:hypothetical protein